MTEGTHAAGRGAPSPDAPAAGAGPIPIVMLNWNGEDDTLDCLRSIKAGAAAGFVPVLVDNGSEPASVARLKAGCSALFARIVYLDARAMPGALDASREALAALGEDVLVFIESPENLGFATASNLGVRLAEFIGSDWVMLLNNDTVVAPDALQELRRFVRTDPPFAAVTAQIRYFDPPTRIQNCGGRLTYLGSRRYHYADQEVSAVPPTPLSVVTFVTGCAMVFRHRLTGPLTEDFFFGEEDYEFALRMRQRGLAMACLHRAVVHHKVGASIDRRARPAGKILVYYVVRLVDVRNYYSRLRWQVTRAAAYVYLPMLLARNGVDPRRSLRMIRKVEAYLRQHRQVGRAEFQALLAAES